MNPIKQHTLTCFFLCLTSWVWAQTYSVVPRETYLKEVKKVTEYLQGDYYSMKLTYSSFIGHRETKAFESMQGRVLKNKDIHLTELQEIKTLNTPKLKLTIDEQSKVFVLGEPQSQVDIDYMHYAFEAQIKWIEKIEMAKADKNTYFRVIYRKGYDLEKIEFTAQDNQLKTWTLYYAYSRPVDENDENSKTDKPKLTILISEFKVLSAGDFKSGMNSKKLDWRTYLNTVNGKYVPTTDYTLYELYDGRLPNQSSN